ncbi:hypothetical protein SKAU_G00147170 [Synaphobranchus kaupii]|uniref:Uncharacterized protein n=1 Tax=Synaphobranchus kaupii TaxID=118154 RepID=A0A9Q1J4J8_SYNKA|nr:hypothetical protein SKAU_G00147170 [Synaphobranchus kaupii]
MRASERFMQAPSSTFPDPESASSRRYLGKGNGDGEYLRVHVTLEPPPHETEPLPASSSREWSRSGGIVCQPPPPVWDAAVSRAAFQLRAPAFPQLL